MVAAVVSGWVELAVTAAVDSVPAGLLGWGGRERADSGVSCKRRYRASAIGDRHREVVGQGGNAQAGEAAIGGAVVSGEVPQVRPSSGVDASGSTSACYVSMSSTPCCGTTSSLGARRIVDFCHRLTLECSMVDDELDWALAKQAMLVVRRVRGAGMAPTGGEVLGRRLDRAPRSLAWRASITGVHAMAPGDQRFSCEAERGPMRRR